MPTKTALLVIDVQQGFCEGEYEAFQIGQVIARINNVVLPKSTPDSFLRTELAHFLKERGIDSLVICGLQSEYCVDTTTRRCHPSAASGQWLDPRPPRTSVLRSDAPILFNVMPQEPNAS